MHNFIIKIKRILAWIPILWNDRDWDYCHLFNIIEFKLYRMERDLGYIKYLVRGKRYTKQIAYCKLLVKLIKEFDHFDDSEIDKKYGDAEYVFIDSGDPKYRQLKVIRTKLTDENMEEYLVDLQNNMLKNEKKYNKLWDRFNRHMKKYHRNWRN